MLTGSCLCGKVRYEVRGPPQLMYFCHCHMCQKATGTAFATNMLVRVEDFVIVEGRARLTPYPSSTGEIRHFCSSCGSPVYNEAKQRSETLSVRCGLLDGDPMIRPAHHIYASFKAPWFEINDGLPCHPAAPP
jgi:hypothetical protein